MALSVVAKSVACVMQAVKTVDGPRGFTREKFRQVVNVASLAPNL